MATLTNTGIAAISQGILMPALTNRFVVEYISDYLSGLAKTGLSQQTVNFKVDIIKGTISFDVQQSIVHPEMIRVLTEFTASKNHNQIKLIMLDGNITEIGSMLFTGLKTIEHKVDFDYATSAAVTHKMVMLYGSMTPSADV